MIIHTPFYFTSPQSASKLFPPQTLHLLSSQPQTTIIHPKLSITLQSTPLQRPLYNLQVQTLKHKLTGEQIQIIRQVNPIFDSYDFSKLSDFQYTPPYSDQQLLKLLTTNLKQDNTEITDSKMMQCLYPQFYLKPFNLKPIQCDIFQMKIKDIQPRKLGVTIKFGDPIPTRYSGEIPESILQSQIYTTILDFYQQRPIFLKNVLFNQLKTNNISCTIYKLRTILSYITYHYKDGPWRGCHVRFNYNPISHHQSLIYQVIVIKIKNKQIQEFESGIKPTDIYDPTFGDLSVTRNYSSYQLCDLDESVKDIVMGNLRKKELECKKGYGWLSKQEYKKIFKMLKRRIKE